MNIHEYQGKEVLRKYGVSVPEGKVAFTAEEAVEKAKSLSSSVYVVKAQIHAGGRGKAGGVKIAKSLDEVKAYAEELLGKTLVTHQTGPDGQVIKRLLIEEGAILKEYYVGLVLDRATSRIVLMASEEGGTEVKKLRRKHRKKSKKLSLIRLSAFKAIKLEKSHSLLIFQRSSWEKAAKFMLGLYKAFVEKDCSIAEINPLVVTGDGNVMALDAKLNFDSNALYRQKDIMEYRDLDEEDPKEIEASKYDLSYISLDGNIGCMVNGAGLAMSTMDIIKHYGGEPANFLDVGGGATAERSRKHLKSFFLIKTLKGFLSTFSAAL